VLQRLVGRISERGGTVAATQAGRTAGAIVESVNVGRPRPVQWQGRTVTTAIWKAPVAGPVLVSGVNVDGDDQADREVHGGVDKALYAYAGEDLDWWAGRLGRQLGSGTFGENLTTRGLDVGGAVVGERWLVGGGVLLQVAQPRVPCFKLGIRMGDQSFPRSFAAAGRPGAYLRILAEGEVAAGDPVRLVHRPAHGLTVADVAGIYHGDHAQASRLLEVPELAESWKRWAGRFRPLR
jgi:MOSC domain-containing protein YiiM